MKYVLLLLGILLLGALPGQQTLHVITTINPHPGEDIAQGCRKDRENVHKLFDFVARSLHERGTGMTVRMHAPDYDPEEVYAFLEGLQVAPDDAVIFIYSGHGLEDVQAPRWPLLYYCAGGNTTPDPESCGYSLEEVHEQLRAKGVRMSLTIGSSCNAEPRTTAADRVVRRLGSREEELNALNETAYQNFDLFTRYEGHILASSALPGQLAYLNDDIGSYYIDALINTVAEALQARQAVSWASILRRTDRVVREEWKKEQEAQFLIQRDEVAMYSDDTHHYPGDAENLTGIDEDEYSPDWEESLDEEEALELLPYYLIATLAERSTDELTFNGDLAGLRAFYDYVLEVHYGQADEYFWETALSDYAEDEEWFYEELLYYSELLDDLDPEWQGEVDDFLLTLGR
ncbi:caspase family protein [Lewinella sp. JB7]|uniref:caspase family protein n=1 Tax=Lewinella sp. JB7 TaxID=2962887 RepID=UPI0020C97316|nr:caspase family protein [Lewinella sp. JB7]MCP9236628.1 caspase family protein [Lewinella sp. JB7]